ncbi:MAG: SurA N-terminal domain-containing protein [Prevotellaceae bacterium]|jgi:peptidyl-prolyl cis-trans isomerase D|nr:SurA N-terminal domain-containing protein [Prevotellaceae bacterium]
MATLGKIRERGVLLLVIVGLALLAFIIGDFISSGTTFFQQAKANVGSVNGEKIGAEDFMAAINQRTTVYTMELGNESTLTDEMSEQIRQETWESLIRENLISAETEAIGMTVGREELRGLILGDNPNPIITSRPLFINQQTGVFDKRTLVEFLSAIDSEEIASQIAPDQLANLREYWRFIEHFIKINRLEEKYSYLLSKMMVNNSLDAKNAFQGAVTSVNLVYALKPYFAIADSVVSVTDKEIKALYKTKKETFKIERNVSLSYVTFSIQPSQEDYIAAEEALNKVKEEFISASEEDADALTDHTSDVPYLATNLTAEDVDADLREFAFSSPKGAVTGPIFSDDTYKMARVMETGISLPDSIKLRRIVIAQNTLQESQAQADSLIGALKSGSDFVQLAAGYSKDERTAMRGGEIGWVREALLEKEIAETVFNAAVGAPVTVASGNVVQIFEVTERSAFVPKVKLALISRKVHASNRTQTQFYQNAKLFASSATAKDAEWTALAGEMGYAVIPANNVNYNTPRLNNLKNSRQIIRWAIDNAVDAVSDVFECDNQLVVATITAKNESEYKTTDEVHAQLAAELRKEKKGELLLTELSDKTIETLVAAERITSDTITNLTFNTLYAGSLGNEPVICGVAPLYDVDVTSTPVKGNAGVYLFKVLAKEELPLTFNVKEEIGKLNNERNQGIVGYYAIEALKKAGKVKDQRYKFF